MHKLKSALPSQSSANICTSVSLWQRVQYFISWQVEDFQSLLLEPSHSTSQKQDPPWHHILGLQDPISVPPTPRFPLKEPLTRMAQFHSWGSTARCSTYVLRFGRPRDVICLGIHPPSRLFSFSSRKWNLSDSFSLMLLFSCLRKIAGVSQW